MYEKATLNQLEELRTYLNENFATINQQFHLRKEIMPIVNNFKKIINEFTNENEQMKEMIRRFDEVLSEKASKISINEMHVFMENNYVK